MTLWKVTASGVRLADIFHGPVHPAAYTLVTATPVALPTAANGSIPAFTPATATVPNQATV